MSAVDPMQPVLAVGTEIAGYRVESFISRGGMAVVYRAQDRRLGRRVALKLLAPELSQDERFQQRFLRESRLAASLDHPNIIPIYEAGEANGLLYIVMRYVEGSDLKELLDREGRSTWRGPARSCGTSAPPSTPPTPAGWSTATSSRATSWSRRAPAARTPTTSTSPTSASPSARRRCPARPPAGGSSARPTTSPRSRSAASRSTPAPTSTRWAACCTSA